jgi:hypothetical protein
MAGRNRERAVKHLQELYTVAIGLALATAIRSVLDPKSQIPFLFPLLPYFISYFATLIPISHGALCHLDYAYLGETSTEPKSGALLIDWLLLFVESCTLLGIAFLIPNPISFSYGLVALLIFDALWAFGAWLAFSSEKHGLTAEAKWSIINGVASALLIVVLVWLHSLEFRNPRDPDIEKYRWILVLIIAIARSVVDYAWCWKWYFPSKDAVTEP